VGTTTFRNFENLAPVLFQMDSKTIIYIAGKGHSGSTLMDLLLSTHPRICGLGEARMLVNDQRRPTYTSNAEERICSCGKSIDQCELWRSYIQYADEVEDAGFEQKYRHLIEMVKDHVGKDTIISDSSKYIKPLEKITRTVRNDKERGEMLTLDDLFVVHLVKDARAWATSMKYRHDLDKARLAYYMFHWVKDNQEIGEFLDHHGIQHMKVTYEGLCFNTEKVLSSILEAAGLEVSKSVGKLPKAQAHIGLGNPMRTDEDKSKNIMYDSRWFYEPFIQLMYYLVPGVKLYNEKAGEQAAMYQM